MFVANAGDCKAVLLRQKDAETIDSLNVSKTFSANKKYEQERLQKEFSNEKDVFVCKRGDSKACYVKGGLMTSRSLGDLRLKLKEFNFHTFNQDLGYRRPIPQFTGPYITHVPDIQEFDLQKEDKYLVLATDGLWDEIKRKETGKIAVKA